MNYYPTFKSHVAKQKLIKNIEKHNLINNVWEINLVTFSNQLNHGITKTITLRYLTRSTT
jgi:hypothetical protein